MPSICKNRDATNILNPALGWRGLGGAALALALTHCTSTSTEEKGWDYEAGPLLEDVSLKVISATYHDLALKADTLLAAIDELAAKTDAENLGAAQAAWRSARRPWEQSEAFLFGPVETQGIDPSIDSWPLNKVDLDKVLGGSGALTRETIDGLEGTQKGFHTLEYLLFGSHADKQAEAITARELEYLRAVGLSFRAAVHTLDSAWDISRGAYALQLSRAGQSGSVYASQKAALQELLGGMVGICDEVAAGKIADPFTQKDLTLEESHFSDNSVADFADNIRSVQNLYLGHYGHAQGQGVRDFVASFDAALADEGAKAIEAAIQAIEAIKPTFSKAVFDNPQSVEKAQKAVGDLQLWFESKILPRLDG